MQENQRIFLEKIIKHFENILVDLDEIIETSIEENDFERLSSAKTISEKIEEEYLMAKKSLNEDKFSLFNNWSYDNFVDMCHKRGENPEEILKRRKKELRDANEKSLDQ